MNWKKFGVYSILLIISISFIATFVAADETDWPEEWGLIAKGARYVFGPITNIVPNTTSAVIITIAVWFLIFLTFGDIFSSFTAFSKWVSWLIALLIGLILANFGIPTFIIAYMTAVFAFVGTAAVYVGLAVAFVTFIMANLGILFLKKAQMGWAMKKEATESKAGAERVSNAIKSLGTAEKAFKKVGSE